ncbi:hypothetical protein QR680_003233 [Steinernema hermaphroditum]|uniref:Uncharacterized protein n=1 Tax=Steinernema hermaphroditum TaxID=289476 RepID=A0AA39LJY3_9BILA|nr:hypothetical protein QR680_003233 [Steinernema hermaphroditum]
MIAMSMFTYSFDELRDLFIRDPDQAKMVFERAVSDVRALHRCCHEYGELVEGVVKRSREDIDELVRRRESAETEENELKDELSLEFYCLTQRINQKRPRPPREDDLPEELERRPNGNGTAEQPQ